MNALKYRSFIMALLCLLSQWVLQPALRGSGSAEVAFDGLATHASCLSTLQSAAQQGPSNTLAKNDDANQTRLTQINFEHIQEQSLTKQKTAGQLLSSLAVMPLDWLKKTTLFVLQSPVLLLSASSIFLPGAKAFVSNYLGRNIFNKHNSMVPIGLTSEWNTETCVGRALSASELKTFEQKKKDCQTRTCFPWVRHSASCNDPRRPGQLRYDGVLGFNYLCDNMDCWPNFVKIGYKGAVRKGIEACEKKACQQLGRPYTGQFVCKAKRKYRQNATKRRQINHALFEAEKCLDDFCQNNSDDTCLDELSWWQKPFSSPCNEDLCPGRFLSKEAQETASGDFKSLETQGKEACKKVRSFKRHCR